MYTVMQYHCVTVCDEPTKQDETFFDVANLKNSNGICVHFIQCLLGLLNLC